MAFARHSPPGAGRGPLAIIFFIVFLDLLGFGIIIPLLPFYVRDPQTQALQVGLLFSIYSICQFIGAPLLGSLSDRFGRRPILAISQVGSTAGYLLLGWVSLQPWLTTPLGLGLIYVSRVIDGLSGGNISTAHAYISDVTTQENRAKGMGLVGAAFGIGFAVGPAVGGLAGHYLGIAWPAFLAAALNLSAAIVTWLRLPESRRHRPTESEVWLHPSQLKFILQRPILLQLLAIGFFSIAAFVMMESMLVPFLSRQDTFHWGSAEVGWFFAFVGVIIAVVQGGLIGRLMRVVQEWPLAMLGPILVTVAMVGFTATTYHPGLALLLLCGAINATGRSLQQPTLTALISYHADASNQGSVFGVYHGLSSLGRVIGPIVAGLVYGRHVTGPFIISGSMTLLLAAWTAILWARTRTVTAVAVPAPSAG